MAVWRLQKNTDGGSVSDYCIKNKVIAMGWSLREIPCAERDSVKSFEDYCTLADTLYDKYGSVSRLATELQPGDLVWMRHEGKYYLARVKESSQWQFCNSADAQKRDACNQYTDIVWYLATDNGDEDSVPGAVATAFISPSTFQRIRKSGVEAFSQLLFNRIHDYEEDQFKYDIEELELNEANFYSLLQPDDAEDLLCMWLYKEKGYICIPSTNKIATPKYECVLIDPKTGKHIYIQVKKGKIDLDANDYSELNGDVYLLTTQGRVLNCQGKGNVNVVSPTTIFEFASSKTNKNLIPEGIARWVSFLAEHKGIMFDTNLSYSDTDESNMLSQNKVCAFGSAKRYVKSFSQGDYVLYYSKGKGVVGVGRVTSNSPNSLDEEDGLYHDVEIIVPKSKKKLMEGKVYISPNEIKNLFGKNFFWASTIKSPFLTIHQVETIASLLQARYNEN